MKRLLIIGLIFMDLTLVAQVKDSSSSTGGIITPKPRCVFTDYYSFASNKRGDTIFQRHYKTDCTITVEKIYVRRNKKWVAYYPSGNIKEEGSFKHPYDLFKFYKRDYFRYRKFRVMIKYSHWIYFKENGEIIKEEYYDPDKKISTFQLEP